MTIADEDESPTKKAREDSLEYSSEEVIKDEEEVIEEEEEVAVPSTSQENNAIVAVEISDDDDVASVIDIDEETDEGDKVIHINISKDNEASAKNPAEAPDGAKLSNGIDGDEELSEETSEEVIPKEIHEVGGWLSTDSVCFLFCNSDQN